MREMFVVVTNRRTWGKGTSMIEALFNALRHDASAGILNIITISGIPIDKDLFTSVSVDEMGRVHYPKGCEVVQKFVKVPSWMNRKFADCYASMADLLIDEKYEIKKVSDDAESTQEKS